MSDKDGDCLEELHERYSRQWREAVEDDDMTGAIYASGKLSGLITAMEMVENEQ